MNKHMDLIQIEIPTNPNSLPGRPIKEAFNEGLDKINAELDKLEDYKITNIIHEVLDDHTFHMRDAFIRITLYYEITINY